MITAQPDAQTSPDGLLITSGLAGHRTGQDTDCPSEIAHAYHSSFLIHPVSRLASAEAAHRFLEKTHGGGLQDEDARVLPQSTGSLSRTC